MIFEHRHCVGTPRDMDVGIQRFTDLPLELTCFPVSASYICHSLSICSLTLFPFANMIAQLDGLVELLAGSMDCWNQAKSILAKTLLARSLTFCVYYLLTLTPIWLPHAILYSPIRFLLLSYIHSRTSLLGGVLCKILCKKSLDDRSVEKSEHSKGPHSSISYFEMDSPSRP